MTQKQLLVWTGWAVCLADSRYAQQERARKFLGNAGASRKQPASSIVHHFPLLFLPSRHTTIYTQKIIQVLLLAVGCDWLNGPNMAESDWLTARERRELWKGRPRFKAGMQIMGVFLFCGIMFIWNMIVLFSFFLHKMVCIQFSIKSEGLYLFMYLLLALWLQWCTYRMGRLKIYESSLKSCFIPHGAGRSPHELCHVDITWPACNWPVTNNTFTLHKMTCK